VGAGLAPLAANFNHNLSARPFKEPKQMPVTIEIPTAFRRFTDGAPKVDCTAATIADALNTLTTRFPELSRHVRDDSGQIRQFLNVYLNEEDIRFLGGESCALKEGDRVLLVPSIAGGSTPNARN
jgi:molybdopterin converting factor small subunit